MSSQRAGLTMLIGLTNSYISLCENAVGQLGYWKPLWYSCIKNIRGPHIFFEQSPVYVLFLLCDGRAKYFGFVVEYLEFLADFSCFLRACLNETDALVTLTFQCVIQLSKLLQPASYTQPITHLAAQVDYTHYCQQAFHHAHLAPSSCTSDLASVDHCERLQIMSTYSSTYLDRHKKHKIMIITNFYYLVSRACK